MIVVYNLDNQYTFSINLQKHHMQKLNHTELVDILLQCPLIFTFSLFKIHALPRTFLEIIILYQQPTVTQCVWIRKCIQMVFTLCASQR